MMTLDEKLRSELCAILALGVTRTVAARYIGCSPGMLQQTALADPEFARQLRQAEGRAEMLQVKNVTDAAREKQDWRASAWILERRFPGRYAKRAASAAARRELDRVIAALLDLIVAEIPEAALRQRIFDRLTEVAQKLASKPDRTKGDS